MITTELVKRIIVEPPRIAVVGDYIEDRYIIADVTRVSPEAPVIVARKIADGHSHGGAGNVWNNLVNIGVKAELFCNGDPDKWTNDKTVHINPNYHSIKTRVISGNHHLIRIDEEPNVSELSWEAFDNMEWAALLREKILEKEFDCIVISDYHKGVVSKSVAEMVVSLCLNSGIPCVVDAKKDFYRFAGAKIIKCNSKEANQVDNIWDLISDLSPTQYFVVTMGADGIDLYEKGAKYPYRVMGHRTSIIDVSGAGDTVTAIIALGESMGYGIDESIRLSNYMASIACGNLGVYAVTHEDLMKYDNRN